MKVLILDNKNSFYSSLERINVVHTTFVTELDQMIEQLAIKNYDLLIYNADNGLVNQNTVYNLSLAIKNWPSLCVISKEHYTKSERFNNYKSFKNLKELSNYLDNFCNINKLECYFKLDRDMNIVTYKGNIIKLTMIESKILCLFLDNDNKVLSKNDIENYVWGPGVMKVKNTLGTHLTNLKNKFPHFRKALINIRGKGYMYQC
jgi:hypothetical protein